MRFWANMVSALKGEEDVEGESSADARALKLLDEEVRQAALELHQAKDALAELMATQKLADEQVQKKQSQIHEHEGYARQALEQNEEALALEVAEKIVELEAEKEHELEILAEYTRSVKAAQRNVRQSDQSLKRLKQQLDTIKATHSVQRAQSAIAARADGVGEHLQTAQESLERLRQRQAVKSAELDVNSDTAGSRSKEDLLRKLEQAGIKTNSAQVDDVLDRLQSKKD